jgi:tetratricopeptide (TPR) repeat protein
VRFESLVRLADPASARLAEQVRVLTDGERHQLAATVLNTATQVGEDPGAGLVGKVVAWQAAHRVRADLQDRSRLAGVQCELVRGLEDLGDPDAAFQVAEAALAGYRATSAGERQAPEHDDLAAAVLRLARTRQPRYDDPLIDATIAAVAAGGAAVGLEARIWAVIDLLDQPGQHERALKLTDQIEAVLSHHRHLGVIADWWRLLLAFHAGRAGYPAITQQLLTPMLSTSGPPEHGDAARAVLYAVGGSGADTRLQITGLVAELAALPPDADDERLRVHHVLAADYGTLGDYRGALYHSEQELPLRRRIQDDGHPDTLDTRSQIARLTLEAGNPAKAVKLFQELLPDRLRILGPDHLDTLRTRAGIAFSTGATGNLRKELQLLEKLLPDTVRVLGRDHPETLGVRSSIAAATGTSGHPAKALRLVQQLLPDTVRVFGPDHTETLNRRNDLAAWTGYSGQPADALRLFQELLPEQARALGPDHPRTLLTRNNVAFWMMECGHPAEALQLLQELLPDQERILGPDHPDTLATRSNIASSTAAAGNPAKALQLLQKLLSDQTRVLGRDHHYTLSTRVQIQRLKATKPPPSS